MLPIFTVVAATDVADVVAVVFAAAAADVADVPIVGITSAGVKIAKVAAVVLLTLFWSISNLLSLRICTQLLHCYNDIVLSSKQKLLSQMLMFLLLLM